MMLAIEVVYSDGDDGGASDVARAGSRSDDVDGSGESDGGGHGDDGNCHGEDDGCDTWR